MFARIRKLFGRQSAPASPEPTPLKPSGEEEDQADEDGTIIPSFPPEPRSFLDEDLENLALIMPAINEAWERCERMSDEEAIELFQTCDPISSQDWKMYLAMNLSHRFIQDHMGITRTHKKSQR